MFRKYIRPLQKQVNVNEMNLEQLYNYEQLNFNIYNPNYRAFNPKRGNQNCVPQTKQKQENEQQQLPDSNSQNTVPSNPVVQQQYNNKSIKGSKSNRVLHKYDRIAPKQNHLNSERIQQNQQNLNYNTASLRIVNKQIHQDYQKPLIENKNLEVDLYQSPRIKHILQKNQQKIQQNDNHQKHPQIDNQKKIQHSDNLNKNIKSNDQYKNQKPDNQFKNQQSNNLYKNQPSDNQYKNHQYDHQQNKQQNDLQSKYLKSDIQYEDLQSDLQYKYQEYDHQSKSQKSDNLYKIPQIDKHIYQLESIPDEDFISSPDIMPIQNFQNQTIKSIRRPNYIQQKSQIQDQNQPQSRSARIKMLFNHKKQQITLQDINLKVIISNSIAPTLSLEDTNANQIKYSNLRRNKTDVQFLNRNEDEIVETLVQTKYQRCDYCMQQQNYELISLNCQHNYHSQCLTEVISNTIQTGNATITCNCNKKIPQQLVLYLLKNHKQIQDKLFKNQLKLLIQEYIKKTNIVYDQNPQIIVKQGIIVRQ